MEGDGAATLTALLEELAHREGEVEGWAEGPRATVAAYREAIDALNAEALRRLIRILKTDPAAVPALKQAAGDPVVYAVLRHHGIVKPSLDERVEAALATVRPTLASHDGDVELVQVAPPTIAVRFIGACDSCPASALTFRELVSKAVLAACPEITDVVQHRGRS
jgi:Fe-S cluster biogenesis protein NfuA